jgi:predicted transcriptional regulator
MPRPPQDVTDAELAVLEVLWQRGPSGRRQITDLLYPGGGPAHYTTVQKLLERLEIKGHVTKERGPEGVLTFTAAVGREELISRRLLDVAEKLCGGSLAPLLMNLVRTKSLTPREIDELRALVEDLTRQAKTKGKHR